MARKARRVEDLPQRRRELYDFIAPTVRETGKLPGFQEMADHMGWKNPSSAVDVIRRLQDYDRVIRTNLKEGRIVYELVEEVEAEGA